MFYNLASLFLLFIIYSILGYIVEVASCSMISKKLVYNRGFLIGPYLPIYGTGIILIISTLDKYRNDIMALFIMSMVYCTVLEYLTSLIMEKIFNLRWWDYSDKRFNVNGRVCLTNGVLFGLGGLIMVEFINPIMESFINWMPNLLVYILSIILFICFMTDFIITLKVMVGVRVNLGKIENKDSTEQIRKEIKESLRKNNYLTTRLIKSFPGMEKFNSKNYSNFEKMLFNVKSELKKIKEDYKKKKLK